jgi:hypothetical protein
MPKVTYILFVLTFWISSGLQSQTVNSNCLGADSLVKKYRKTADKLAILHCVKIGDTYKDSIKINPQIRTNYMKALLAVYNATVLPGRDTVVFFNVTLDYKFWPYAALNSVLLEGDSSKTWVANLRQNILPCGQVDIDNLVSRHYLKVTGASIIFPPSSLNPFNVRISLKTDTNCYTNKLCDKFNALYPQGVGVGNASPQSTFSDSYNITDSVNVNFTELTYSIGWGDCMAGCIYRRSWKFRVYNDCSVEYKGSTGNTIPPEFFTSIKENKDFKNNFKTFPNPANDKVKISTSSPSLTICDVELIDLHGNVVFKQFGFNCSKDLIDVAKLCSGVYYVKLGTPINQIITKLIVNK